MSEPRLSRKRADAEESGDAADLHDLIGEAAAMRTVLGHLLGDDRGRIHDSGCGTCDAGRALLTADHELPSYAAALRASHPLPSEPDLAALREALARALDELHADPNGYHHCRWCSGVDSHTASHMTSLPCHRTTV